MKQIEWEKKQGEASGSEFDQKWLSSFSNDNFIRKPAKKLWIG